MKWPIPMPLWLTVAFASLGLKEIPGKNNNPTIIKWLKTLKAWWSEDETPWCGTFVAHCLKEAGVPIITHWYRAKAWAEYGQAVSKDINTIPFGAIGVKSRVGGGHVFFIVAKSADGRTVFACGGNQGNMVNIVPMALADIDSIRWPGVGSKIPLPVATKQEIGAANAGSEA